MRLSDYIRVLPVLLTLQKYFKQNLTIFFSLNLKVLKEDKKCDISIKLYHQLIGLDDFRRDTLQYECDGLKRLGKPPQNTKTQLPEKRENPEKLT